MMSMTDSQSVPLSAIQISPDYSAAWSSETCHAQSCGKRLDHALLHHRFPYSIATFEIVTPERVIVAEVRGEKKKDLQAIPCKNVWVWKSGTCNAVCGFYKYLCCMSSKKRPALGTRKGHFSCVKSIKKLSKNL